MLQAFRSATSLVLQEEGSARSTEATLIRRRIALEPWVRAVIKGADAESPRWRHLLPISGLLLGMERHPIRTFNSGMKGNLCHALVKATNMALEETRETDGLPRHCITLVLNYTFEMLPEAQWRQIIHDVFIELDHSEASADGMQALLPSLMSSAFFGDEGFQSGYFLGAVDADIVRAENNQYTWSVSYSRTIDES